MKIEQDESKKRSPRVTSPYGKAAAPIYSRHMSSPAYDAGIKKNRSTNNQKKKANNEYHQNMQREPGRRTAKQSRLLRQLEAEFETLESDMCGLEEELEEAERTIAAQWGYVADLEDEVRALRVTQAETDCDLDLLTREKRELEDEARQTSNWKLADEEALQSDLMEARDEGRAARLALRYAFKMHPALADTIQLDRLLQVTNDLVRSRGSGNGAGAFLPWEDTTCEGDESIGDVEEMLNFVDSGCDDW